jgi:hypothetical protein
MQTKSVHIQLAREFSSGVHPLRALTISRAVTLTATIAGGLLLAGCAKDPVAGLTELPNNVAKTLRPIPGTRLLGNTLQQAAAEPPPPIPPGAHCPVNASITYYDAQITTPIIVCFPVVNVAQLENALLYSKTEITTFKLTDASVFADLKDATLWRPPFACQASNGPWSARITATRSCQGTCSPRNQLIVVGVPNNVSYGWYGALDVHPAGFEFVNTPTVTNQQDLGQCNPIPLSK